MTNDIRELRAKYKFRGYSSLTDIEKIKLLLSYSESDSDLDRAACAILKVYRTVNGSISNDVNFLIRKCDITLKSAILLKLVRRANKVYNISKISENPDIFHNLSIRRSTVSAAFFNAVLRRTPNENFIIMAANKKMNLLDYHIIKSDSNDKVNLSYKKIIALSKMPRTRYILFSHCHPTGHSTPSDGDTFTTKRLKRQLWQMGIKIIDHVIVGNKNVTTMFMNKKKVIYHGRMVSACLPRSV